MPFRADPSKEYYAILGLKEDASEEEIRKAYRKLALHYHPDRNRGNPGAEERFKAISEAYGVLMEPDKRRAYDLSRRGGVGAGAQGGPQGYSSQEEILRDLLRNQDAAAIFQELTREFQRMGFRFDDGFVRHMFLGGRGVIFGGGIFFGGPFMGGRRGEETFGAFGRRRNPWQVPRPSEASPVEGGPRRALGSGGLFGQIAGAVKGIANGVGVVLRLALGSGRPSDVTRDFPLTAEEAQQGGRKLFRAMRNGEVEEIMVTVPAGIRSGTKLRLRGKGQKGGDLYLRVQVNG
ncbi:MAG TPA: DnaJ domain-containing protein [Candidatus Sulfotelmatobacter sp.]|nr:DnaJ domain-containing protein [Candidatus Sulfotelmatobacter sp.]